MTTTATSTLGLYERLGKEPAIDAVVDEFYKRVLIDSLVSPFFTHVNIKTQSTKQKQFFNHVLGGKNYYGKSMRRAHKGMGITDEHFDRIVQLLDETMRSVGVKEKDIEEVLEIVETTRDDCCDRDGSFWTLGRVSVVVCVASVVVFGIYRLWK
jgi:hemoglobin